MMLVNINISMVRRILETNIELTDGNIIIRPCQLGDAAVICEGVQETMHEMLKWAPWCHPGYSVSDCTSWLSSRSQMWSEGIEYDFVIFDTKDNTFLAAVLSIKSTGSTTLPLSAIGSGQVRQGKE